MLSMRWDEIAFSSLPLYADVWQGFICLEVDPMPRLMCLITAVSISFFYLSLWVEERLDIIKHCGYTCFLAVLTHFLWLYCINEIRVWHLILYKTHIKILSFFSRFAAQGWKLFKAEVKEDLFKFTPKWPVWKEDPSSHCICIAHGHNNKLIIILKC